MGRGGEGENKKIVTKNFMTLGGKKFFERFQATRTDSYKTVFQRKRSPQNSRFLKGFQEKSKILSFLFFLCKLYKMAKFRAAFGSESKIKQEAFQRAIAAGKKNGTKFLHFCGIKF